LAREIRRGDRRALSKGITLVENEREVASKLLRMLKPSGHAFIVGVTGPPGTGKSTLVDRLISLYRKKGLSVGVIAVDPTSPITGGALLGDRIRMASHTGDRGVYIRSMASRGWSGGLSGATSQAIQLMDAAGFDVIFLETVGIGQSDIEVVGVAHAVLVVLMPGLGDDVQVSKAGLMEIGDVYVVNKADMVGSDSMVVHLLGLVRGMKSRSPPVIKVSALTGEGLETLEGAIEVVRSRFGQGDPDLKLRSVRGMIVETARWTLMERLSKASQEKAEKLARLVVGDELSIDEAAARLAQ
jgi:LAO/AO transport system kinase